MSYYRARSVPWYCAVNQGHHQRQCPFKSPSFTVLVNPGFSVSAVCRDLSLMAQLGLLCSDVNTSQEEITPWPCFALIDIDVMSAKSCWFPYHMFHTTRELLLWWRRVFFLFFFFVITAVSALMYERVIQLWMDSIIFYITVKWQLPWTVQL